jgi:PAS domain S-box-containing protein
LDPSSSPPTSGIPQDPSGTPARPYSILLVEDNPIDAKVISAMITKTKDVPFIVDHVSSLESAERRLSQTIADVVLLDLTLPDSSGLPTLERLLSKFPNVPVVVLTGVDDESVAMGALEKGAQDYLIKGKIETAALSRAIRFAIRRMRASEDFWSRFTDILQNEEDITLVVDEKGILLTLTPAVAKLLGYESSAGLMGRPLADLVFQPTEKPFPPKPSALPPGGAQYNLIPFRLRDGNRVNLDVHASPTSWQQGLAVHLTLHDPSHRQAAEEKMMNLLHQLNENQEQLRKLDGMKDDFLSTVSHELRTPLTSITGYLKLLTNGTGGPLSDLQKEFAVTALRNAERLALLVNNLLDLSRLESGRNKLNPSNLPAFKLLDDSVVTVKNLAEQKKITLIRKPDPGPDLMVTVDTEKIIRCLVNFLSNAIKFTPEAGSIYVGAHEGMHVGLKGVFLSVQDTGVGIPRADLERVFDKFYQVDNTATRKANGTGLGLAIVKEIVQAHGGDVWAESEEGVGSTFQIFLPSMLPTESSGATN